MATPIQPEISDLVVTLRLVRGYRFLDRCGEALIKLEKVLDKGWLPLEATPKGGAMRHYANGLILVFDSSQITVQQEEFIHFEQFFDQASKAWETIWRTFEIEQINAPAFRINIRIPFDNLDDADAYLRRLNLVTPGPRVTEWIGNEFRATQFALVTEDRTEWHKQVVTRRQRVAGSTVNEAKVAQVDSRLVQRISLIPQLHRETVRELKKLRQEHRAAVSTGVKLEFEHTIEDELDCRRFPLGTFLREWWQKVEAIRSQLPLE